MGLVLRGGQDADERQKRPTGVLETRPLVTRHAALSICTSPLGDEFVALLQGHGFDVADNTHPRYPNEWRDDPPLGLVRIKGVWLPNADTDPDEDRRVTFSLMERWSVKATPFVLVEREGLWLAGYAYNGYIAGNSRKDGDRNHRHDFDPMKPDDIVYHRHPFGEPNEIRVPEAPISAGGALDDFRAVLVEEIAAGRLDVE